MNQTAQFTATEAAFVLREPLQWVRKSLDSGPVKPALARRAGMAVRTVDRSDLVYLLAVRSMQAELTPRARAEFYTALRRAPVQGGQDIRFGRLRVVVADLVDEVEKRTQALSRLAAKVRFRNDGEPVLRGTGIEVHRIAALLDGGLSIEEVHRDYPSLSKAATEAAREYAAVYPKAGRPYPRTTAKRALRGAGLEAIEVTPRRVGRRA